MNNNNNNSDNNKNNNNTCFMCIFLNNLQSEKNVVELESKKKPY